MELCETCTKRNCKKRIVVTQQDNITTIKCLDYKKDKSKIHGYVDLMKAEWMEEV